MAEERKQLRLFVSQPMSGRTDEEIFEERWEALDLVQSARPDRYVTLVESFLSETPEGVHPPLWYLGASLQLMAGADMVFMAPGWASARGCQLEHMAARKYGLDVAYHDQFLGAPKNESEETDSKGE